jgi:hypothetical protein
VSEYRESVALEYEAVDAVLVQRQERGRLVVAKDASAEIRLALGQV